MSRSLFDPARLFAATLTVVLAGLIVCGPSVATPVASTAFAQENDPENVDKAPPLPLVVVNVAGVERLLTDVDYMFKAAGREDMTDQLLGLINDNLGDLRGMDRKRPFGMMLFLKPGLVPSPAPVGFVPVDNIGDLLKTVELGPVTAKKLEGEGRYEIIGPRRTMQVRIEHGYAFIGGDEEVLDREFPDPADYNKHLTTRYDLAATVNINSIPEGMKTLFLTFLRSNAEAEWQRRDEESEAAWRLRKARGESDMGFLEQLLNEGSELTFGWDASQENKRGVLEIDVTAKEKSPFAKILRDLGGAPSRFHSMINESGPMTMSVSWNLNERDKKTLTEALEVGRLELNRNLADEEGRTLPMVDDLIEPLLATVKAGHIDGFARFEPADGNFVLYGGLKVSQDARLAKAVSEVARRYEEHPALKNLELNAESHDGVSFHRIVAAETRDEDERLYGADSSLMLGAGRRAVWFAVGGGDAMSLLTKAMDTVEESLAAPGEREPDAPFRLTVNISDWLKQTAEDGEGGRFRDLATESFSDGGDQLQVTVRPTETGVRVQVKLDEGFLRLMGKGIGDRVDRSRR